MSDDTIKVEEAWENWLSEQDQITEGEWYERAQRIIQDLKEVPHGLPDTTQLHILDDSKAFQYNSPGTEHLMISGEQARSSSDGALAMTVALAFMESRGIMEGFVSRFTRRFDSFNHPHIPFVLFIPLVLVGVIVSAVSIAVEMYVQALLVKIRGANVKLFLRSDQRAARMCLRAGFDADEIIDGLSALSDMTQSPDRLKRYRQRAKRLRQSHLDGSLHHYTIEDEDWLDEQDKKNN